MDYDIGLNRKTHDLALDTSDPLGADLVLISNAEGVAQQIKMALLLWAGEWFLDTSVGVPYQSNVFIKNPDLSTIRSILTATIAAVPHVIVVDYLSLTPLDGSRSMSVTFGAATDYGYVNSSTILSGGN
jgi:hypothetical protein